MEGAQRDEHRKEARGNTREPGQAPRLSGSRLRRGRRATPRPGRPQVGHRSPDRPAPSPASQTPPGGASRPTPRPAPSSAPSSAASPTGAPHRAPPSSGSSFQARVRHPEPGFLLLDPAPAPSVPPSRPAPHLSGGCGGPRWVAGAAKPGCAAASRCEVAAAALGSEAARSFLVCGEPRRIR